jgi:hypothetical protein
MTTEEKQCLRTAIMTISDPRGNWEHGWRMLCELAETSPEAHLAPFRKRSDEELRYLGNPSGALKLPPQKSELEG